MQANTYIHVSLKAVQYRSRVKQYWRKANFVPRPFPFGRGYLCINDCSSTTVVSTLDFWGSFSQMWPSHVVHRTRVPLLSLLGYVNCMLPITTSLFCFQQKRLSRSTLCYLATKLYLRQTKPFNLLAIFVRHSLHSLQTSGPRSENAIPKLSFVLCW